jgi:hypothetical protein
MKANDLRASVLLGMQVALLGCIGCGVRKILCRWNDQEIRARAIFDGEIPEEDAEAMLEAETEIMASFPDHDVSITCERCDAPLPIPRVDGEYAVFARLEK